MCYHLQMWESDYTALIIFLKVNNLWLFYLVPTSQLCWPIPEVQFQSSNPIGQYIIHNYMCIRVVTLTTPYFNLIPNPIPINPNQTVLAVMILISAHLLYVHLFHVRGVAEIVRAGRTTLVYMPCQWTSPCVFFHVSANMSAITAS